MATLLAFNGLPVALYLENARILPSWRWYDRNHRLQAGARSKEALFPINNALSMDTRTSAYRIDALERYNRREISLIYNYPHNGWIAENGFLASAVNGVVTDLRSMDSADRFVDIGVRTAAILPCSLGSERPCITFRLDGERLPAIGPRPLGRSYDCLCFPLRRPVDY